MHYYHTIYATMTLLIIRTDLLRSVTTCRLAHRYQNFGWICCHNVKCALPPYPPPKKLKHHVSICRQWPKKKLNTVCPKILSVTRKFWTFWWIFQTRSEDCQKRLISFVVSVSVSLAGFSLNLLFEYFSKIRWKKNFQVSLTSDKNNGHFIWWPTYIYGHISLNSS